MSQQPTPDGNAPAAHPHRLELLRVDLVGGGRDVRFNPGLNLIIGDITTGKTTFIRLIRALLGTMPSGLPPEVDHLSAIRGQVILGDRAWQLYRPRTTTHTALVEVGEMEPGPDREPVALRLPVGSSERTYSTFLLDQLHIPSISVPQSRNQPTGTLTPVTMTDWLGYCIITGDEMDTEVFGHRRQWRDVKRTWIFQIAYGYYEPELARLNAELKRVQQQLSILERDAEIRAKFLAETPFADVAVLEAQLADRTAMLERVRSLQVAVGAQAAGVPGVEEIRRTLLATRAQRADAADGLSRVSSQLDDLTDLRQQLSSQSARLTRAIVADEWLVDFDFIVCPRCGTDLDAARVAPHLCYLCQQEPHAAPPEAQLPIEQSRIVSQIQETDDVIASRRRTQDQLQRQVDQLDALISQLSADLDQQTRAFVSDQAARIEDHAAQAARLEADIRRLHEYAALIRRHEDQMAGREELERRQEDLHARINARELSQLDAEDNVLALERRMLEYLHELHIPDLGEELTVKINRSTYLPEVCGRTFEELSSQGLKTLVNVAHALAHHTVAIDRNLPLPGLLILDGISANSGHEGFDLARVRDVYRLLTRVSEQQQYANALQIVAVDNELARSILLEFAGRVVLALSQDNRLIRIPAPA